MKLFDTHTHICDEKFDADRESIVQMLQNGNVKRIVEVACTIDEAKKAFPFAQSHDFIYAAAGIHPHYADSASNAAMDELAALMHSEKCVALGEIGLDYHYDLSPRDAQKKWFATQLELAQSLDMPVILHVREAYGNCMDILRAHKGKLKGVMHCFSGSLETAYECIELGLFVAFGGSLTFKNARRATEIAAALPIERIVIETDCPYMTPEPLRGRRNDPSLVEYTAKKLAELRGVSVDEIAEKTYENAIKLFEM